MLRSILPKKGSLEILLRLEHASSMLQCVRSAIIPMPDALELVEQIRSGLRPLEAEISCHPYLKALEEGRVQGDSLKVFAGQQHHIISSDLRSIALILSRQGMLPSLHFLMNVLQGEAAALDALHAFTRVLGLNTGDLEIFEPWPDAQGTP